MITDIHEKISAEFIKKKLAPYTTSLNIAEMANWAEKVAHRNKLDAEKFEKYVKELFWGLASIQLSLGYTLIALNDSDFPSGKVGETLKGSDIPSITLADIHYWHHLHNTWESIYRFWERAVSVLEIRLTPAIDNNSYFNTYLDAIKGIGSFIKCEEIIALRKFLKAWNKIAFMRNKVSHDESNPCSYLSLDVNESPITNLQGMPITKIKYELPNLKQETETVINSYKKTYELLYAVKKVCDSNIKPNTSFKGK